MWVVGRDYTVRLAIGRLKGWVMVLVGVETEMDLEMGGGTSSGHKGQFSVNLIPGPFQGHSAMGV